MIPLLLSFLVAALLGWALLHFLHSGRSRSDFDDAISASAHPNFIADAVFSRRDWAFVQQEFSPPLNSLFIRERRALAIHWLRDCLARIHSVRANHLRQSRHSQDLNVFAEAKLLLLFLYLSALCRCLLLAVHLVHPATPRAIALYVQDLAGRVLPGAPPPTVFARVPVSEVSRNRL
jgi:hypothetical protein